MKQHFPKTWIDNISRVYNDYIHYLTDEELPNKEFFVDTGHYIGRNDKTIDKEVSDYFNRTLYSVNICILDYVCKNFNKFKGKKFIDNGSGFGILSIYLAKLGIECYNYDEFTQMNDRRFADHLFLKTGIKINKPSDILPLEADVLTSSSIWVTNSLYNEIVFETLLIDYSFEHKNCILDYSPYLKQGGYQGNLVIYERRGTI